MTTHLALGVFAIAVALVSFAVRFVLPRPLQSNGRPQATLLHDGWFSVVAFTALPLVAGMFFLAAWWQQADHGDHLVQSPSQPVHAMQAPPRVTP